MCKNKWYKDHSLLLFNDEYLFVLIYIIIMGIRICHALAMTTLGFDSNVFDVLFVTQIYRSFWFVFLMRHFFYFPCMLRDWLCHDVK